MVAVDLAEVVEGVEVGEGVAEAVAVGSRLSGLFEHIRLRSLANLCGAEETRTQCWKSEWKSRTARVIGSVREDALFGVTRKTAVFLSCFCPAVESVCRQK